jgi:hypothetical protein
MKRHILLVLIIFFFGCEQHNDKGESSQRHGSRTKKTTKKGYNFSKHSNFKIFWTDFRTAINAGDKQAILRMTAFPFVDNTYEEGKTGRLTAKTSKQFLLNYDKIFTIEVIKAINHKNVRGWIDMSEDEIGSGEDVIKKGEYILEIFEANISSLVFAKRKGIYKLCSIPYYS